MTSIKKALMVIDYLGQHAQHKPVRLVDLVGATGLSKPTVHRILRELKEFGVVSQDPHTQEYSLGSKVLVLAAQHRGAADLQRVAVPLMRELAQETGANIHLGIRDGLSAVYVEKIDSPHPIRLASRVGQRALLHSTAMGKLILAFSDDDLLPALQEAGLPARTEHTITDPHTLKAEIERVRSAGYSVDEEENESGVRCVAGAIFDHRGELVAALSISGTLTQISRGDIRRLGRLVKDACLRLSREMGYQATTGGA